MPLSDTLDTLAANSKNSISIQFKSTSLSTFADVKSRKRAFLREPAPHELLLQDLCAGTLTIEELRRSSDRASTSKSAQSREIHTLLQLKRKLGLPSMFLETKTKTKAEEIAPFLEEKLSSIELRRNSIKKMIAKESELVRKSQLESTDNGDIDMDDVGGNEYTPNEQSTLEFNRRKNEIALKIESLPLELGECRKLIESKTLAIKEQQEIEQALNQMVQMSREHHLQDQLSKCRQEWEALALEQSNPSNTISTTRQTIRPTGRPRIRQTDQDSLPLLQKITKLLHSDHQGTASTDLRNLPRLSKSLHEELQSLMSTIESNAFRIGTFPHVYHRALNAVQHSSENQHQATPDADQFRALFPHGAPPFTSLFQANQESSVIISILLELDKQNGSMALADLTRFVQDLAKEQGHSEQEAIQCIYTLVGVGLVMIDRSQNDSIVKIPN